MRPLRLQIEGLRSYRQPVDIPFDREGLIAIVGDTGAGKSSILEAITYALYSATSWDQRNVRALISNGAKKASVVFDFAVGEKSWQVSRATGLTGQPVHLLTCISDPSDPLARVDGEVAVNAAIEKIVGLDYDTFQSAVVLPQGRFQQLLLSRPGERAGILKNILGLEQLEAVRDMATRVLARLLARLREREEERQQYRPSPVADLRLARESKAGAEAQVVTLSELEGKAETLTKEIDRLETRVGSLRRLQESLATAPSGTASQLGELLKLEKSLDVELAAKAAAIEEAEGREREAVHVLDDAARAGAGVVELALGVQAVVDLKGEVEGLPEREQAVTARGAEHADAMTQAETAQADLAQLQEAVTAAEAQQAERRKAKEEADKKLGEVSDALSGYRSKLAEAAARSTAVTSADVAVAEARTRAEASAAELGITGAAVESAEAKLREVQQRNAAAHAAHGAEPGDPCPVCSRPLPAGFMPPQAAEEEGAAAEVASARARASQTRDEAARRDEVLRRAGADLEAARQKVDEATNAAERSRELLIPFLGTRDLASDDATLVAPFVEVVKGAAGQLEQADVEVRKAAEAAAGQRAVARERADAVTGKVTALESARRELRQATERMTRLLEQVPLSYRPVPPVTAEVCVQAQEAIDDRRRQLDGVETARQTGQGDRQKAEGERDNLHGRRRREVDEPLRGVMGRLGELSARVAAVAQVLEAEAPRSLDEGADLAARAAWADQVEAEATSLQEKLRSTVAASADERNAKESERSQLLREAGFDSAGALTDAVNEARARRLSAERDEAEAERQIPIVATLDAQITPARGLAEDLQELAAQLTDAKFIKYVATRRQQALLAAASEILASMTGDRYGFSADFQIIDRMADLPRDAKTLSGGETFLASLALALGLLEVAGRSGGRLDALFLDEGFGSLDASALDEALSELERVAGAGRLVAVVSHLKAVAERIDDVLYVSRRAGDRSSEARWIGPEEREALMMRDVEQALLA